MSSKEKEVFYKVSNTYSTLNSITSKTKNIWIVFHGIGYLSRYFLKYFDELNSDENYIIAAQAQSKYYLGSKYKHVGACWLTKENTVIETQNAMRYIDEVLKSENLPSNLNYIFLGYSQGVSIAMRYLVHKRIKCDHLVLMSGGIPKELEGEELSHIRKNSRVSLYIGSDDEYLSEERLQYELKRYKELFGNSAKVITFQGRHEFKKENLLEILLE